MQLPSVEKSLQNTQTVAIYRDFPSIRDLWLQLQDDTAVSAYQTFAFAQNWFETVGLSLDAQLMIIVIYRNAVPMALLPLFVQKMRGLRCVRFIGDKDANYHMALARPQFRPDRLQWYEILRAAAAQMQPAPHYFHFFNQPDRWQNEPTALSVLPMIAAASPAWWTHLQSDADALLRARSSKDARKKLARKRKRLQEMASLTLLSDLKGPEAEPLLQAFLQQRARRMAEQGLPNPFAEAARRKFLHQSIANDTKESRPGLSWFALRLGERIIATYAGYLHQGRFSAMVNSFDCDAEIAFNSPGELLLADIIEYGCHQGWQQFDLGVGDARYKRHWCPQNDELYETLLAFGGLGHLAVWLQTRMTDTKRFVKQTPWIWNTIARLRAR